MEGPENVYRIVPNESTDSLCKKIESVLDDAAPYILITGDDYSMRRMVSNLESEETEHITCRIADGIRANKARTN